MSQASTPVLTDTISTTAALAAGTFATKAGAQAAAAGRAFGLVRAPTTGGSAQTAPVDVLGTATMLSAAAIAVDAAIEVGAAGKGVTRSAGVTVARALEAATAADQLIEVLLIPN